MTALRYRRAAVSSPVTAELLKQKPPKANVGFNNLNRLDRFLVANERTAVLFGRGEAGSGGRIKTAARLLICLMPGSSTNGRPGVVRRR